MGINPTITVNQPDNYPLYIIIRSLTLETKFSMATTFKHDHCWDCYLPPNNKQKWKLCDLETGKIKFFLTSTGYSSATLRVPKFNLNCSICLYRPLSFLKSKTMATLFFKMMPKILLHIKNPYSQ